MAGKDMFRGCPFGKGKVLDGLATQFTPQVISGADYFIVQVLQFSRAAIKMSAVWLPISTSC